MELEVAVRLTIDSLSRFSWKTAECVSIFASMNCQDSPEYALWLPGTLNKARLWKGFLFPRPSAGVLITKYFI